MSLPVSTGDVIAVSILIKDLIKALDDSRGSAAEYQEVIRELWSLDKALLEVEHLSRTCETTIELNALTYVTRKAAEQCRLCISAFLDRIKSYSRNLGHGGSGSRLRDTAKKIQWTFMQKDELAKFRTEVNGHTTLINMLLITTSINYTKLTGRNVEGRLEEADRKHSDSSTEILSILSEIQRKLQSSETQLEVHSKQLDCQKQVDNRLVDEMQYFATLTSELKESMSSILTVNRDVYKALLGFQSRVPREFETCWIQEPIMLTDALGRIMPIHIELINSWEVFDTVLAARFIGLPGQSKIAKEEVAFQDRDMAKDVERSQSFEACFLPGRRIDMSMVFKQKNPCTSCPKCGVEAHCTSGVMTQCSTCSMWFQRVEEISEDLTDRAVEIAEACSPMGDIQPSIRASEKRKRAVVSIDEEEEDIRAFQRVRLLLQPARRSGHENDDSTKSRATAPASRLTSRPCTDSEVIEQNESNSLLADTWSAKANSVWSARTYDPPTFLCDADRDDLPFDDIFRPDSAMSFNAPFTTSSYYSWLFETENDKNLDALSVVPAFDEDILYSTRSVGLERELTASSTKPLVQMGGLPLEETMERRTMPTLAELMSN